MCMAIDDGKDFVVKVYLDGADWIGLRDMAGAAGLSQSAFLRQMLRHAINHHARDEIARERRYGDRTAPDLD